MTAVKTTTGQKILVQIGDGGSPTEVFAHDCLINAERGIKLSTDMSEYSVPDCDNPDNPMWKETVKKAIGATITGSGLLHTASIEAFFAWLISANTKNVRLNINVSAANGGGYVSGAFHLSEFEIKGTHGEKAEASITLVANGALTWTDAT